MDHGNYLKLCFSRTCLPSNHTNTWGNLSIFIRPPSSLPGVVANGQPHLRWERHRTASPTRPNDTVPGVSVVFPGWANFWWSLERGLRFSLAFLVGICWKVGNYCIFKNTWYASCVVYLDFCWAGRKTHTVWEMCWHLMEWWHVKRNKKVLLADQLKVAPPVSCQSQKRPAGSHRLKPLDASQLLGIWINHDISTSWNRELFWLASPWPSSIYLMRSRRPESLQVLLLTGVAQSRTSKLVFCLVFFVSCASLPASIGAPQNWMSNKRQSKGTHQY